MYNEEAVKQFNELVKLLKEMSIPTVKRDLTKQENIRWIRKFIKPDNRKAKRALKLLALCDQSEKGYCGGASPVWQQTVKQAYVDREDMNERYLKEHNLEVTSNSWPGNPPKVYSVKLNFTAEEWLDLMDTEGEFLPACCATISRVRDILIGCVREGGFIRATDLCEIVQLLKDHHDCDEKDGGPQAMLINVWNTIEKDAELHVMGIPYDLNDVDDAFSVLYKSAAILGWNFLSTEPPEDETFEHEKVRLTEFVRVVPVIRTIYNELVKNQDKFSPFEGFAVMNGEEVLETMGGLAIFRTKERAERIAEIFKEKEEEDRERRPDKKKYNYEVKKVRVSLQNGLQILG